MKFSRSQGDNRTYRNAHHRDHLLAFPKNFEWGSSTSAHQVEGNNTHSDWWQWEPGHVAQNQTSGEACDHYRTFQDDFNIIKQLNHTAHRLGIEWARLEPKQGEWDQDAIEHYHDVFRALKKRNIKIMLTLHHFTNPAWFSEQGGWEKKKNIKAFVRFVEFVTREYHEYIDWWITINEPMVYLTEAYIFGHRPPQKVSLWSAYRVYRNMARAHRLAYKKIHKIDPHAKVGLAHNVSSYHAYRKHALVDQMFEMVLDRITNHAFLKKSGFPRYYDFLGLNYYFHIRIKQVRLQSIVKHFDIFEPVMTERRDTSDIGWELYPHGIFNVLMDFADCGRPIYITENGIATDDDKKRQKFIHEYLTEIWHAINGGADVRGYFYWSLLDNFEWEAGFGPRFGLVYVDYQTQKRTLKQSAHLYADICKKNGIEVS